jgi:hypothetical protein
MVESNQVAKVRKPAPDFEAMAWWNGFKKVKLSQFRGNTSLYLIFDSRKVRRALLLAP